jgi:flagellin-like hook-associated protein FlgL
MNRIESIINNNSIQAENTATAESRIMDADMAKETVEFTKHKLIQNASMETSSQFKFFARNNMQQLILQHVGSGSFLK